MTLYLINILLALVWVAITGSYSLANIVFGFLLGALALYLIREQVGSLGYFRRGIKVIALSAIFIYELVLSAWRVAMLVLSPRMELKPGIFAYPLKLDNDFEITLLANLITLTPGTLSVDVSEEDRKVLYIHALDCSDPDALRRDIAQGFERRVGEAFR